MAKPTAPQSHTIHSTLNNEVVDTASLVDVDGRFFKRFAFLLGVCTKFSVLNDKLISQNVLHNAYLCMSKRSPALTPAEVAH